MGAEPESGGAIRGVRRRRGVSRRTTFEHNCFRCGAISQGEREAGSHGTLYAGERRTTVKDRKKEIGKGLLAKMLTDLGIDKDDF